MGRASLAYRTATGCEDKVACSDFGSKWLAHPETASAIAALRDVDALDLDLGPDSILRVAASMLVLDPLELVDDEGNARQMAEIPASVRTALQGVKMTSKTRRRGRETTVTETTTDYKLADKTKVLDMLMRHHGLLARDNMQAGLANAAGIAELLGKQGRNNSVEPGE